MKRITLILSSYGPQRVRLHFHNFESIYFERMKKLLPILMSGEGFAQEDGWGRIERPQGGNQIFRDEIVP
jgi:hypothetical protein